MRPAAATRAVAAVHRPTPSPAACRPADVVARPADAVPRPADGVPRPADGVPRPGVAVPRPGDPVSRLDVAVASPVRRTVPSLALPGPSRWSLPVSAARSGPAGS